MFILRWSVVVLLICFVLNTELQARGRRGGSSGYSSGGAGAYALPTAIDARIQVVAQQRAEAMASRRMLTHDIHMYVPGCPTWTGYGALEGIGCATSNNPSTVATCICGSTVVADASARGSDGQIYRVRFFR